MHLDARDMGSGHQIPLANGNPEVGWLLLVVLDGDADVTVE